MTMQLPLTASLLAKLSGERVAVMVSGVLHVRVGSRPYPREHTAVLERVAGAEVEE